MATIDEATRPGGVNSTPGGGSSARVVIAPAKTVVGPAEQAARDTYSAELKARADAITDPEISREMSARARRVQSSLPICEFFDRLSEIKWAGEDLQAVSGLEGITLRGGLNESAQALRDVNVYPPLLLDLVQQFVDWGPDKARDACVLPDDASETDKASVAATVELLGLNEVGKSAKPLSIEDRVNRAVKQATAPLRAQTYALHKELCGLKAGLDTFKAERGIK